MSGGGSGWAAAIQAGFDYGAAEMARKGPSPAKIKRNTRINLLANAKWQPHLIRAQTEAGWDSTFDMAQKHGVHPLVAMGLSPGASGGGVTGVPMGDQSYRGSHIAAAGDAIAGGITRAEAEAQNKELFELQKDRLRAEIQNIKAQTASLGQKSPAYPGPIYGQYTPYTDEPQIKRVRPPEVSTRQSTPPHPHETEGEARFVVNADGKIEVIPKGTPGDQFEVEFGDLGQLAPSNIARFWRYLKDNDYVPSENDWAALAQDYKNFTAAQKAAHTAAIKKYFSAAAKHLPWNRDYRSEAAKKRRNPRSYR